MDVSIIKRDDVELQFTFVDADGNAVNLTGGVVYLTVKSRKTDTDANAVISKEKNSFSAPVTGVMTFDLTDAETDIDPGLYYFDVQFKDSSDKISSSVVGRMRVTQDVTTRIV